MNLQGKLVNSDGTNITDGMYYFRVSLYDSAVGGSSLISTDYKYTGTISTVSNTQITYTEDTDESTIVPGMVIWNTTDTTYAIVESVTTGTNTIILDRDIDSAPYAWSGTEGISTRIQVTDGIFNVKIVGLGSLEFNTDDLYLEIAFDSTPAGGDSLDETFSPRKRLDSVPYAFRAKYTDNIACTDCLDFDEMEDVLDLDNDLNINLDDDSSQFGMTIAADLSVGARSTDMLTLSIANDETYDFTGNALEINLADTGSTGQGLFILNQGTGASLRIDDESGDTNPFIVTADGTVGIGTTSPLSLLHVVGGTNTEYLTLPGNVTATGTVGHQGLLTLRNGLGLDTYNGGLSYFTSPVVDRYGNMAVRHIQAQGLYLRSSGTFSGTQNVSVGADPRSIALGDVDGDSDLDFVMANGGSNTVSIRMNDGSGTFSGTQNISAGTIPNSVVLGDIDGDGDLDLAIANSTSNNISIRVNDGTGTFSGTQTVDIIAQLRGLAIGDLDGDGDLDLVAGGSTTSTVYVIKNDGNGIFSVSQNVTVGDQPIAVALGDIDGDGDLDLAAANRWTPSVSVRVNDGSGTFSGSQELTIGTQPFSVAFGDLDGDGDLDITSANIGSSTVSIRVNDGTGTFSGTYDVSTGTGPSFIALGDVDGDSDMDFVTSNYGPHTVSVRTNDGSGTFSGTQEVSVGTQPSSVALGDLDGDGDLDIATANYGSGTASIRLNDDNPMLYADSITSRVGIGTTGPDRTLDVLDASGDAQLRLSYTDGTVYSDFETDSSGYLNIDASGNRVITTDSLYVDSDSAKLYLGNDADLEIFHNGANATIDAVTGMLYLDAASDITFRADNDSDDYIYLSTASDNPGIFWENGTYDPYILFTDSTDTLSLYAADGVSSIEALSITTTQIRNKLPTLFEAAGDVSIAYDLVFTNTTAAYISFEGSPGYIRTYHPSGNYDLTLSAANSGVVLVDDDLDVEGDVQIDSNGTATTNGLCHSGADSDTTFADRDIVACSAAPGDIAEWYDVTDAQTGDIVVTTDKTITYASPAVNAATGEILNDKENLTASVLERSSASYQSNILGVISTSPYETFGKSAIDASDNPNPVALIGRVPVNVTTANGAILPGDPITTSDMLGVGMKATKPGFIVGRALEPFASDNPSEVKKILVFINISWYEPDSYVAILNSLIADYQNGNLGGIGSTTGLTGGWSFDGSIISTPAEVAASSFTGTSGTFSILRSQTITIGGDTFIVDPEGNVDVAGDIVLAGVLSGRYGDLTIKLNDTDGTSKFRVTNAEDKEVFSVSSTGKIGVTEDVKGESDNAVAGTASIEKGKNSLVIETTQITSQSKIQITFRSDYTPATRYWISDRTEGERFTVSLNANVAQDSTFDWWIIN